MWTLAEVLLFGLVVYPVITAAAWMAGAVIFRIFDESGEARKPEGGWPGVSVLIPAYNEQAVIATCVASARAVDYPVLEIIVLDDGSVDQTEAAALSAAGGDSRCRVITDSVNRGKAERLNVGFHEARHELVAVIDADTHIHPDALKFLVARISSSPVVAAVAGAPHVTNRGRFLLALQVLEAAAVIGLIRRTQSVTGRVGVVAGVLGLFRRDRVLAVGGFDSRMATEDIDLSWKLLLSGWQTLYEPRGLVGMQVPSTLGALWKQRTRWARGQGEVLRVHLGEVARWRNHRMWLLALESVGSLIWIAALACALFVPLIVNFDEEELFDRALSWGIAFALVATFQVIVGLSLEHQYDVTVFRALVVGVAYPIAYWLIIMAAALHSELIAVIRGPRGRVVWDIPREQLPER